MKRLAKMTSSTSQKNTTLVRPIHYRDLETVQRLAEASDKESEALAIDLGDQLKQVRRWYAPLKFFSWFPNPCQYEFCASVAEQEHQVRGMIQVSPFNRTRSTWRIEQVLVDRNAETLGNNSAMSEIGSMLLRHCFETITEASNWVLEVNVNDKSTLGLYRQNGFQPLAQLTNWAIAPELLAELAEHEPDLPNLLPVSNADAQLLYQLDTVAMPPLLRQVFDRQIHDFKTSFVGKFILGFKRRLHQRNRVSGYVFEPQRKAAIGYFHLQLCRNGSQPHLAHLTVHPAYTWLYPELLAQMARVTQDYPAQALQIASADYQPEREEYFERLGAERIEHSLLMSRSVWHKLRETKSISLEGLQLAEVLQSLQPARKPVPSRLEWRSAKPSISPKNDLSKPASTPTPSEETTPSPDRKDAYHNGHQC